MIKWGWMLSLGLGLVVTPNPLYGDPAPVGTGATVTPAIGTDLYQQTEGSEQVTLQGLLQAKRLVASGQKEQALELLRKLVKQHPAEIAPKRALADLYAELDIKGQAIDTYQQLLLLNPRDVVSRVKLGLLYAERKQHDLARDAFLVAADLEPHDPAILNNLGSALLDLKQYTQARRAFEQALKSDPNYLKAKDNLKTVALREREQHRSSRRKGRKTPKGTSERPNFFCRNFGIGC